MSAAEDKPTTSSAGWDGKSSLGNCPECKVDAPYQQEWKHVRGTIEHPVGAAEDVKLPELDKNNSRFYAEAGREWNTRVSKQADWNPFEVRLIEERMQRERQILEARKEIARLRNQLDGENAVWAQRDKDLKAIVAIGCEQRMNANKDDFYWCNLRAETAESLLKSITAQRDFLARCQNFDMRGGAEVISQVLNERDEVKSLLKSKEQQIADMGLSLRATATACATAINGKIDLEEELKSKEERIVELEAERDELLYHTRHGSPDDVAWHSPRTVGHLRRQLETLDPNMAIGCAYFVKLSTGENIAGTTGVSMSYERVNNETSRIEGNNKDIPRGIIIWAHSTDAEGKQELAKGTIL